MNGNIITPIVRQTKSVDIIGDARLHIESFRHIECFFFIISYMYIVLSMYECNTTTAVYTSTPIDAA